MFKQFKAFTVPLKQVFKDPDTGRVFTAATRKELVKEVVSYRANNSLEPLDGLNIVIDTYQCNLPENLGNCLPLPRLKRGLMGFLSGGMAVIKNLRYPKLATQEVADARSEQCKDCPNNVFLDKGMFVAWQDEIALNAIGERKSKFHNDLGNCGVCSCPLRAKVFWAGPIELPEDQKAEVLKVNCWQVK